MRVRSDFMARYDTRMAFSRTYPQRSQAALLALLFSLMGALIHIPAADADAGGAMDSSASYHQVLITEHGDADVLEWVESTPLPTPGPGEVRVRVVAASASFTDIMVRKGIYSGVDDELPYPPGYDMVGVVDALGPGVTGLEVGQRVADLTVWGAYTEYMLRPADGLVPVPDGLAADDAAVLVLSYLTAYQMLFRSADVQPEQVVLIHGASGAVGTALAQLGRVAGLKMYGTASTGKQDYVRELGVTPIDYQAEDFTVRIMEETDGVGVDVVFDAVGVDNFKRSYGVLAPGGVLVTYGLYKASLSEGSRLGVAWPFVKMLWQMKLWDWFPENDKRVTFYSIQSQREAEPGWFKDDLTALFELALEGNLDPQIWRRLPLRDAAEAHRLIESGKVRGKIVLQVSPDA
jgi:NADPH:quinone reductase-like Zn-dependent oxidoreductase